MWARTSATAQRCSVVAHRVIEHAPLPPSEQRLRYRATPTTVAATAPSKVRRRGSTRIFSGRYLGRRRPTRAMSKTTSVSILFWRRRTLSAGTFKQHVHGQSLVESKYFKGGYGVERT